MPRKARPLPMLSFIGKWGPDLIMYRLLCYCCKVAEEVRHSGQGALLFGGPYRCTGPIVPILCFQFIVDEVCFYDFELFSGTTAHIGIKLYGEDGKGEMRHLTKPAAFQRNCTDKFLIAYDTRLGDLKKILIWHDNTGLSPSWYLSHVIVKDLSDGTLGHGRTYYFVGNAWLSVEMEPGLLKKEIPAANELAIQTFSNTFKMAASHGFADKHLWMSLMDRHDHSRFTRVQRASCCVTVILFFMMVNAIWYGIIKTSSNARADYSFSWEEVVIGLVSNVVVFPVAILLVFLFKSSRSKVS